MKNIYFLKTLVLTCLTFAYCESFAQDRKIIPFKLTPYNNISIEGILNSKDTVQFMVHTAASAVSLTEDALKKIPSLQFDRLDTVKSWGGDENTSRVSHNNKLQIGNSNWNSVTIWENKFSGQETDGKIGLDLFENKFIEIDYDKKLIYLSDLLPTNAKQFEKIPVTFKNDNLFVEATIEINHAVYNNKYLIHSGYAGAVLLDDAFVANTKINEQLQIVDEKSLKDSFGNILKTQKAFVPEFSIGKEKFKEVSVGFFHGAIGRQKISVIGGDVLKRFNTIIDAKRENIYIKSNSLKDLPYASF